MNAGKDGANLSTGVPHVCPDDTYRVVEGSVSGYIDQETRRRVSQEPVQAHRHGRTDGRAGGRKESAVMNITAVMNIIVAAK